jgi:hypothetical protein
MVHSEIKNDYYKKVSDSKKRKTSKKTKTGSGVRTGKIKR